MHLKRKFKLRFASLFALALIAATPTASRADDGSVFNAWKDVMFERCFGCFGFDVGNPNLCPCRIADPIIIQS